MKANLSRPSRWASLLMLLLAGLMPAAALAAPLRALITRTLDTGGNTGQYTSLALDASGNPVVSYRTSSGLKLARCSDPTCAAPPTILVLDAAESATSLVLDAFGNPVVSYHASSGLTLARCGDPACAALTISLVDSETNAGSFNSLALNAAGNPVISYRSTSAGVLKLARCSDPTCTAPAAILTLDSANGAGVQVSLALDSGGNPVMSYTNTAVAARDLMLARCNDPACASFSITNVDSVGTVGSASSLELDTAGNPVISYYDFTNTNLKLAHCSVLDCAAAVIAVIDGIGSGAAHTSLELDASGNPVISYYDSNVDDLRLAHCGDPACATAALSTIDSVGTVGQYNSLALDCAGNPVISYYRLFFGIPITGDLKFAADDSTDCTPAAATAPARGASASKEVASSGVTTLQLGRIWVSVPASAIPSGESDCKVTITQKGESGEYGFSLDDTVWDVKVLCSGHEVNIFFDALTICIRPKDGVVTDKNVYHRHSGAGFQPINGGSGPAGYVCGQTRLLSLFTLGQLALPATGFAPGAVTEPGVQPEASRYFEYDALTLEIPQLNVVMPIWGVPQSVNGWDVSWLGKNAGYLYGTAFPTWVGNSVLTAHVWNADNTAGPFYHLRDLQHGDQFYVHSGGQTYVYEVRTNRLVSENNLSVMKDSDYSLITLITCESFNEVSGAYRYRRAVQAVLVQVD